MACVRARELLVGQRISLDSRIWEGRYGRLTWQSNGHYRRPVPRNVICVSHDFGAAGEEIGRLVAERLGYRYLDGEILTRAAERGDVDPETVADAEKRRSLARRLLGAMGESMAVAPEAYAYIPQHEIAAGPREDLVRQLPRACL